ncbi:sulfatase family protein [Paenibacillus sacheonensis]|uniref:Sulfatase-like hydrolase/transferase n=1 Tax=Paenibacillus sacheonensis TaxID=742054 RepID=A0A7X4YKT6_9BACL|nr:sulfatase [Paenibacillus sacheonensis]MBM7563229.1 arylsulfatase A-like enzyme [Paenibacillus sacheonensis]NBC68210.1 sulfatase-like hydrolase/transferase [Paenibacillus sacheonensis]
MSAKKPNLILFGIDSLRRDHMSGYGYGKLTTPYIDRLASEGVLFEQHFSPSIPTTPAYASMLTGHDVFGTDVVALRHEGPLGSHVKTLPEVLEENGYNTTCVGFTGNPSSRGFQTYLNFESWLPDEKTGRTPKAENLNDVAVPELERLAADDKPFFLFLRHMDPHSPYLPPQPFDRMFYGKDEKDPSNTSMEPVYNFRPFGDFLKSWIGEEVTDQEYVTAQYDGSVAYMDICMQTIFTKLADMGIEDETLIVITADHGETLYEHDCFFDHHGLYDNTLVVPLIFKFPGRVPAGKRVESVSVIADIMPTVLSLLDIDNGQSFDGRNLVPFMNGQSQPSDEKTELYITECTWMRKHGWRTPEWKLIVALEPDFHGKPEIELYNLIRDPEENVNLAEQEPGVVELLRGRMLDYIAKREGQVNRTNPIYTNTNWNGQNRFFESSEDAYNSLYIGSIVNARSLQAKDKAKEQEAEQEKETVGND